MRWTVWQGLVLALFALGAQGGCHLIFPFTFTAAEPAGDGGGDLAPVSDGPADAPRDSAPADTQPFLDHVIVQDMRVPDSDVGSVTPGWTTMSVTGASWLATATPSIWGLSSAEIYLCTGYQIFRCEDKNPALICTLQKTVGTGEIINDLGGAGSEVFAVGQPNLILAKSKGWANVYTQPDKYGFYSVWCTAGADCVLAAKRLVGSPPATTGRWQSGTFTTSYNSNSQLNSAWRDPGGLWVTVGAGCNIGTYLPGSSWDPKTPCSASLRGVWGQGTVALAVGTSETRLRFNGTIWTTSGTGTVALNAVWGADLSNVYAVGQSGKVRRYNGTGWDPQPVAGPFGSDDLSDIWGVSKDRIYIVGPNTRVFRYGP